MPERNTLAIICESVEDAKYASEVVSPRHHRLFLVQSELPGEAPWLRASDAMLNIGKPAVDSSMAVAARAALLYSPSWCVALVDVDNLDDDLVEGLMRGAERDGFCQRGQAWACTKAYAVQYGAPGLSGGLPAAPKSAGLTEEQLAGILMDLVPMFGVKFSPSVGGEWAWVRRLLEGIADQGGDATHCHFITDNDDLQEARMGVKKSGRVVLLTTREPSEVPQYTLDTIDGKVLIYSGLK